MANNKTAVIIGGGLGGLFTGALLTREGVTVTVLEKNAIIGGGLQCFKRNGTIFETGMHILGGFENDGCIRRICEHLGIMDHIHIKATDADAIDSITYGEDGRCYTLPRGREAFTAYLQKEFPKERIGIEKYMEELYAVTEEVDLFYLRPTKAERMFTHSKFFFMPVDEFISSFVTDQRLHDLLAYMSPLYGGKKGHTPAFVHAMINVLYINGSCQFVDGSQQLADSLASVITENGGRVLSGDAVVSIEVNNRQIEKVVTKKGKEYQADWYISDIHPTLLFGLLSEHTLPKHYVSRISSIPNSYSAFTVYITFKPESQPYVNHPRYFQERYGDVWNLGAYDADSFPQGFMYVTPPTKGQGKWAKRMIVNTLMPFSVVQSWENTTVGHRGQDYEAWKEASMNKILDKIDMLHPGFRGTIASSFASSPLTIRDYYGTKDGSLYGHVVDCQNFLASQMPIATKIHNLLLTGQNVNLHGICGVPLTALETAEAIVGNGIILNKLNNNGSRND